MADSVGVTSLVVASVAIVVLSADASVKALVPVVSAFPAHPLIQIAEDKSRINILFFMSDQPSFLLADSPVDMFILQLGVNSKSRGDFLLI
ncbi:MAG: hypothetical protein IJK65_07135 [Clostridiales bacterium]|nr:hypothetical protein [Clostridiales bacterium]